MKSKLYPPFEKGGGGGTTSVVISCEIHALHSPISMEIKINLYSKVILETFEFFLILYKHEVKIREKVKYRHTYILFIDIPSGVKQASIPHPRLVYRKYSNSSLILFSPLPLKKCVFVSVTKLMIILV